jgi:SprT protein
MLVRMDMIDPITQTQQQQVLDESVRYIKLAELKLQQAFPVIPVYFDLKGRAAGMYKVQAGNRLLRFNPYLFARYYKENFNDTIPHEVAHYLVDMLYGIKNVRPHGKEWKAMMHLLGAKPQRTHQFDLQGIPQRTYRHFRYQCNCNSFQLTSRRHNLITRGQRRYFCPNCKSELQFSTNG